MKLHADPPSALNSVTAYGPGFVEINRVRHTGHLLLLPDRPVQHWAVAGFDALQASDFALLVEFHPDLILLGTGAHQHLARPPLAAALRRLAIGIEVMDTRSACRTYNILVGEGRKVGAALLIDF